MKILIYAIAVAIFIGLSAPTEAAAVELHTPKENFTWLVGNTPDGGPQVYDRLMDQLWRGTASFRPYVSFQIQTIPDKGRPFFNGMNEGTQIVPMNGVWYLFNREYDFAPHPPECRAFSRIVVRKSTDLGHTWSKELVIAQPAIDRGECVLGDGYAFWDSDTNTWHYLAQVQTTNRTWNINHFSKFGPDPMGTFNADPQNPVIRNGELWSKICGPGKVCPSGTAEEGTPEVSEKKNGTYYVTFHGANIVRGNAPYVEGYRGIVKTKDFHAWVVGGKDIPNDAIWSGKDCYNWNVAWERSRGCIGGGHASTLITQKYTYLLVESSDISIQCINGQHWVAGLARAPGFQFSGHWQQWPGNPLLKNENGGRCSIQYPRLFRDGGHIYLSYWTLGPQGAHDPNTMFNIEELVEGDSK